MAAYSSDPCSSHGTGAWAEHGGEKGKGGLKRFVGEVFCFPPVKINNRISVQTLVAVCHYLELLLELSHILVLFLGNAKSLTDDQNFGK